MCRPSRPRLGGLAGFPQGRRKGNWAFAPTLLPREETTLRDLRHQGLGDTALHTKKAIAHKKAPLLRAGLAFAEGVCLDGKS